MTDIGLAGRVAVVTGGARGIGKAIGVALAAEGVHVVVEAVVQGEVVQWMESYSEN